MIFKDITGRNTVVDEIHTDNSDLSIRHVEQTNLTRHATYATLIKPPLTTYALVEAPKFHLKFPPGFYEITVLEGHNLFRGPCHLITCRIMTSLQAAKGF
jgi:hypothetical protein